ncbi:hypothetical protein EUGRSUZ_E02035 [Eucalyptus grandis]|uniref:Uncharacterized protein n=2 Tax=Eucalyptus grandis TaxID=71139 RepID=A0ACC3KWN2_EUCGR|nr:hypothetical protein EUGRSUZ_E02035 [Eucalyptus grandis]
MYIGCRVSSSVPYYFGKEKEIVTVTNHLIFHVFAAGRGKCTPFVLYFAYYFVYWSSSNHFFKGITSEFVFCWMRGGALTQDCFYSRRFAKPKR